MFNYVYTISVDKFNEKCRFYFENIIKAEKEYCSFNSCCGSHAIDFYFNQEDEVFNAEDDDLGNIIFYMLFQQQYNKKSNDEFLVIKHYSDSKFYNIDNSYDDEYIDFIIETTEECDHKNLIPIKLITINDVAKLMRILDNKENITFKDMQKWLGEKTLAFSRFLSESLYDSFSNIYDILPREDKNWDLIIDWQALENISYITDEKEYISNKSSKESIGFITIKY